MNLLFRMVRVVVWALFGRRCDILAEQGLAFRVWPNDLDVNLHMNNGRYLTVMDLGRTDLLIRCGLLGPTLRRRWMPVLGAASVVFRRSLAPFQRYRLVTRLLCWDDKWFYFEQRLELPGGRIASQALVKALFRVAEGTVPTVEVMAALGRQQPSPPMPEAVAAWLGAEDALRQQKLAA